MSLNVNFLGKIIDSPFILASAPPTKDLEKTCEGFEAGWDGAVIKSITLNPLVDKNPRIRHFLKSSQNYEMGSIYDIEQWLCWIDEIKSSYPNKYLIISLFGMPDLSEWIKLSEAFLDTKAEAYELNFSCPHSKGKGSVIGQDPELCASITKTVKEVVGNKKKIIDKFTYLSTTNSGYIAKKCVEAGADGFTAINTIPGLSEININTLEPKLNTGSMTTYGGIGGRSIYNFGLLITQNIASMIDYKKHNISGLGGINSLESALNYVLYGATTVQLCTEVMRHGYGIVDKLKNELESYLDEKSMSLEQLRGYCVNKVTDWFSLDSDRRRPVINYDNCVMCNNCITACDYDAIKKSNDKIIISIDKCDGCGSCMSVCNNNALYMNINKN